MSATTEISATEDTVKSVLSRSYRFIVPEYQREYSWSEDQWQEFWSDLLNVVEGGGSHFLGSIVVVEKNTSIDQMNEYEVVDGQQRLTTISILLCTIRQYYDRSDRSNDADTLSDQYLFEKDDDFNPHQKIKLNELDNPQYRRVLNGNSPRQKESQIKKASEFFESKLLDLEENNVDDIRKHLLNSMSIVTIECDNQESAFRLFETLNDRGLELSAVDLMKNHLYKAADERSHINSEAIQRDWEAIIDDIRYELDDPYRFFIQYIFYAPEPEYNENISENTLYDRFKYLIDEEIPDSDLTIADYISRMADHVMLYLNIVNSEVDKYDNSTNKKVNELLSELDRIGYTQERTYLMGILSNIDTGTEVVRAIQMIESFVVRRRFTSSITGSDLNELYARICAESFRKENPLPYIRSILNDRAPTDDEFTASIMNNSFSRSQRTLYFLEKLESEYFQPNAILPPSGEIEHIAPRKSFTAKKYNKWTDYLDVGREEFDGYKDQLGNLTILEKKLNIQASDNPFEQKKERYVESNYKMPQQLCQYDIWDSTMIEQRTRQLANVATDVWNFDR